MGRKESNQTNKSFQFRCMLNCGLPFILLIRMWGYIITTHIYIYIYTIAIKLSIFLYDPDFQSNEKKNEFWVFIRHVHLYFGYQILDKFD